MTVFSQRGQLQPSECSHCSHLPSPACVLVSSWWQGARHSRKWASFGASILSFFLHLAPACIFPCPLLVCGLLTHFNPCLSHRFVCSVFDKDDLVLTLTFTELLPCWPLSCLLYLLGCYLQFLERYWTDKHKKKNRLQQLITLVITIATIWVLTLSHAQC